MSGWAISPNSETSTKVVRLMSASARQSSAKTWLSSPGWLFALPMSRGKAPPVVDIYSPARLECALSPQRLRRSAVGEALFGQPEPSRDTAAGTYPSPGGGVRARVGPLPGYRADDVVAGGF